MRSSPLCHVMIMKTFYILSLVPLPSYLKELQCIFLSVYECDLTFS